MVRAKKKKKPPQHRPAKSPYEIIRLSNALLLACIIRTMWTVYGWRAKRISVLVESMISLLGEVYDGRRGVIGAIADCKALTGIDCLELVDELDNSSKRRKN